MPQKEIKTKSFYQLYGCRNCGMGLGADMEHLIEIPFGKKAEEILKNIKCKNCGTKSLVKAYLII